MAIHVVGVAQQTFRLVSCRLPWHGTPATRISPCGEGRATNSSLHIHASTRIAVDCCCFAVCCTLDSGSVASTQRSRQKKKDSLFSRAAAAAAAVPQNLELARGATDEGYLLYHPPPAGKSFHISTRPVITCYRDSLPPANIRPLTVAKQYSQHARRPQSPIFLVWQGTCQFDLAIKFRFGGIADLQSQITTSTSINLDLINPTVKTTHVAKLALYNLGPSEPDAETASPPPMAMDPIGTPRKNGSVNGRTPILMRDSSHGWNSLSGSRSSSVAAPPVRTPVREIASVASASSEHLSELWSRYNISQSQHNSQDKLLQVRLPRVILPRVRDDTRLSSPFAKFISCRYCPGNASKRTRWTSPCANSFCRKFSTDILTLS